MAVYSVGTIKDTGEKTWWVNWQAAGLDMTKTHDDVRPATPEEAKIMEKFEWGMDTHADRERLIGLLRGEIKP